MCPRGLLLRAGPKKLSSTPPAKGGGTGMGCRTRARHRQKKKKIHAWQTRKYKINYRRRNDSTLWSNAAASFSRRKKDACKRTGTIFQRVLRSAPPQNYDFTKIPNYISTGRLAPLFFLLKRDEKANKQPHMQRNAGGKGRRPSRRRKPWRRHSRREKSAPRTFSFQQRNTLSNMHSSRYCSDANTKV